MTPLEKSQFDEDAFCGTERREIHRGGKKDRVVARDAGAAGSLHPASYDSWRRGGWAVRGFRSALAATVINLPEDAKGTTTIESKTNFIGGGQGGDDRDRDGPLRCIADDAPRSGKRGWRTEDGKAGRGW